MRPLLVILGPTASGKSHLAIHLAEKFSGEIVCCDSTQIYRHFDIGTGKVPPEQQRGIPHHLVNVAEPEEVFTAGEYRRRALEAIDSISARGNLPILTAGTGLYLRALLEGLADAPARSEELRDRLRGIIARHDPAHLHRILKRLDPEVASRIAPQDAQKTIRALEIRLLTGETVSVVHSRGRTALAGYQITKIGLLPPRKALYERIALRVEGMFAAGWLQEVAQLKALGVRADAKPFTFIGYSQLLAHLDGRISLSDSVRQIQQATRQYAKRQITWFRKEKNVLWLEQFGDESDVLKQANQLVVSKKNAATYGTV